MGATFIALLSGGLDSTVAAFAAARAGGSGRAVVFDYGQKAAKREMEAAKKISRRLGAELQVIELPFLEAVTRTALVMNDQVIPQVKMSKLDDRSETEKSAAQVWVPNRNGLFLNVAASLCEGLGIREIVVGFNAEEAATFPDNSANFLSRAESFFELSTLTGIRVKAPTLGLNKTEIVRLGMELDAPFQDIWSCYLGGKKMCGRCESCLRSIRAYRNAGLEGVMKDRFEVN
jgi:7-cyano-7-deazaguanine synthase